MGFLADKKILITGLLSKHSIAYGIAKACHREGAQLAFTYQNERFEDRIKKFAAEFGSDITIPVDVSSDEQIDNLFVELGKRWDGLDGLVHSIAYAPTEAIEGDFLNGITRDAFRIAHDISSYSLAALAKSFGRTPVNYLGSPDYFVSINVISGFWQSVGWESVIYVAAIAGIDPELYEAARIDGATDWQTFRAIALPLARPMIVVVMPSASIADRCDNQNLLRSDMLLLPEERKSKHAGSHGAT